MNDDLCDEVEAINSIYGTSTLRSSVDEPQVFILRLPQRAISLRVSFPVDYPAAPLSVLGTESSGDHVRKGEGANVVLAFRNALKNLYQPGVVCLFDVIEDVNNTLNASAIDEENCDDGKDKPDPEKIDTNSTADGEERVEQPIWILSNAVTELKSVFIARCTHVSSSMQANLYLQHLLNGNKKVRSATHNIIAWRIKGGNGVTYQDCDDDGETAAGGRLLHMMQMMGIWDTMVVVSRWYGGHHLGPKRFSVINTVARDAFVKRGLVQEQHSTARKGQR